MLLAHTQSKTSFFIFFVLIFLQSVSFADTSNYDRWMGDLGSTMGDRLLNEIALPGSHDMGMNVQNIHDCTLANLCNTATQNGNIFYQLNKGSRYFDVRPAVVEPSVFSGTVWSTAHTSVVAGHQLGCEGERITSLRDGLYRFFQDSNHQKELVILKVSHCSMEPGKDDSSCTETQMKYIAAGLDIDHRLIKCDHCDLKNMTLNTLLSKGNILLLTEGLHDTKRGFFSVGGSCRDDYLLYDSYANSNDFNTMRADQFSKLKTAKNHQKACEETYPVHFLLSWTLTLSKAEIVACEVLQNPKIINLAQDATSQLQGDIKAWVESGDITKQFFPNILYTDAVEGEATEAAIYLNTHYNGLNN